jgi:hypothetical protein
VYIPLLILFAAVALCRVIPAPILVVLAGIPMAFVVLRGLVRAFWREWKAMIN